MEEYETNGAEYTDGYTQETQTDILPSSEEDGMEPAPDDMALSEETPADTSPDSSGGEIDPGLTGRLDALIEILTPEDTEGSVPGDAAGTDSAVESDDTESTAYDSYTYELLESINGSLAEIKSAGSSYQEQTAAYQEEMLSEYKHMSETFEYGVIVLFAVGFFTALSCGCRFASTFFNRMRG
ncbi:MAG: hypothetical protein NC489_31020 [Ruminococcus flavefaciens]|nr:hypothetical protein [Ruminococcus flavefaciens]